MPIFVFDLTPKRGPYSPYSPGFGFRLQVGDMSLSSLLSLPTDIILTHEKSDITFILCALSCHCPLPSALSSLLAPLFPIPSSLHSLHSLHTLLSFPFSFSCTSPRQCAHRYFDTIELVFSSPFPRGGEVGRGEMGEGRGFSFHFRWQRERRQAVQCLGGEGRGERIASTVSR